MTSDLEPENTIAASAVPSPVVNDNPVKEESVRVPLLTDRVT